MRGFTRKSIGRKFVLLILVGLFASWVGWNFNSRPQPGRVADLSKAGIESEIKEALRLKEIRLNEEANGGFAGNGVGKEGAKYKIKVTRSENKLTWESEDDKGAKAIGTKRWQ
jgi:hypothetical protein